MFLLVLMPYDCPRLCRHRLADQSILQRDITPTNIVEADGQAVMIDFTGAKILASAAQTSRPQRASETGQLEALTGKPSDVSLEHRCLISIYKDSRGWDG